MYSSSSGSGTKWTKGRHGEKNVASSYPSIMHLYGFDSRDFTRSWEFHVFVGDLSSLRSRYSATNDIEQRL